MYKDRVVLFPFNLDLFSEFVLQKKIKANLGGKTTIYKTNLYNNNG
jgi:hypothetical protein